MSSFMATESKKHDIKISLNSVILTGIYDDLPYSGTVNISPQHTSDVTSEVSKIGWLSSERATELLQGPVAVQFVQGE
jgi:hypothetical protein